MQLHNNGNEYYAVWFTECLFSHSLDLSLLIILHLGFPHNC